MIGKTNATCAGADMALGEMTITENLTEYLPGTYGLDAFSKVKVNIAPTLFEQYLAGQFTKITPDMIPNLKVLRPYALYYYDGLTWMDTGDNLREIRASAFTYSRLKYLRIGKGVISMTNSIPSSQIEEIVIDSPRMTTPPYLLSHDAKLREAHMENVYDMNDYTFYGCNNLERLYLSETIKRIPYLMLGKPSPKEDDYTKLAVQFRRPFVVENGTIVQMGTVINKDLLRGRNAQEALFVPIDSLLLYRTNNNLTEQNRIDYNGNWGVWKACGEDEELPAVMMQSFGDVTENYVLEWYADIDRTTPVTRTTTAGEYFATVEVMKEEL